MQWARRRHPMLFNSHLYLLFLPVVVTTYFLLPLRGRRLLLLLASYTFYWVWSVPFSLLLVASTLVDYAASRVISRTSDARARTAALLVSIGLNLGVLALFKYADFFSSSAYALFDMRPWPELNLILPLGISFYTFQTMSYTIDVYRGRIRAHESLLDVALYVSFFPQLVAGPIVRADVLMPQLRQHHVFDWERTRHGIGLILWGLLKKIYIADSMGPIVSEAYGSPTEVSGVALLVATYAFALQIYCDFSAYSDIAIGSARILGIELPKNFESPYLACSLRDFWRRWHISLSTWLRDYLYIPLGGSRRGPARTYVNLLVTMILGGLWHGAGWNWVVWGAIHGGIMAIERRLNVPEGPSARRTVNAVRWFITFHIVCVGWVFFRATDLEGAILILDRIGSAAPGHTSDIGRPLLFLAILLLASRLRMKRRFLHQMQRSPSFALWCGVVGGAAIWFAPSVARNPEFIYFQF
jgi:alginate O-acetyltransferase complex protein AlgI